MPSSENFDPGRIKTAKNQIFGIKISLPGEDTFANLLGSDWQTVRWYANRDERDQALTEMSRQHEFSRSGDEPRLIYECVQQSPVASPQIGPSD